MIHRFKVSPIDECAYKVYLDGKKVRCSSADIRLRPTEIPSVKIGLICSPDAEIEGILELDDKDLLMMIERKLGDREFCDKVWKMIAER